MNIFDGRDILVVARLFDRSVDELVITFTGRAASPPVSKGFGENYLMKRKISAVHFISKDNHWWQTPEPAQAIDELRRLGLLKDRRLTLYGSSMGGYAALMLSGRLKPRRIILFSPQYSIDAAKVPFETRWRNYAAKVSFDHDDMVAGIDHDAEIKTVFDPFFEPDRRHVELIEALRPMERIAVPFAGHNTARALEELGIVTKVTDPLLAGTFDPAEFRKLYRNMRPRSSLFWYGFAETLARRGHMAASALAATIAATLMSRGGRMQDPVLRRDILRLATVAACEAGKPELARSWLVLLDPIEKHPHYVSYLRGLAARAEGDWPQVLSEANEAIDGKADRVEYLALKLEAMTHCGDAAGAVAICESKMARVKRSGALLLAYAIATAASQQPQQALDILRLVFRFERRNPRARVLATQCWTVLGRPEAAEKQLAPVLRYDIADDRLAEEIGALLVAGGSRGAANRLRARHARYAALFDNVVRDLEGLDWSTGASQVGELRRRYLLKAVATAAPKAR